MTLTIALAYLLILGYFVVERSLRKGKAALSLKPNAADAGSSQVLWISGALSLLIIIIAPVFNRHEIGYWNNVTIGWLGLVIMLGGLTLRYWAAHTLGQFYTRTLQIVEGQEVVDQAPYSVIRHPGYLGTLLLQIGAGLAVTNWIVLLAAVVIGTTAQTYRIRAEEKMLQEHFGETFQVYSAKTWKLLPFVY